ncbi:MAG TPA: ABC transporter substrate-binding protein, partial [Erysipelothrix sp.]|nr:ABC transporter substrate-binding protein [Erysipelothrix sp.]
VLIVLLVLAGCSSKGDDKVYTVGVLQFMDHPSLEATLDGLKETLDDQLGEDGYKIVYKNAAGEMPNNNLMAEQLVDEGVDLIYAIATPSAQAAYAATEGTEIPVVFNAVTDPVDAGLVESMDKTNTHASGVSDVAPIDMQLALIKEVLPDATKVGILYSTSEANSLVQLEIAKEEASKIGLEIVDQGVAEASHIETAALQVASEVDAIYNITDNMIVTATAQVVGVANDAGIPVFAAEAGQLDQGILATDSIDYHNLGNLAGEIVVDILVNGKDVSELSVLTVTETVLYLNEDVAEALNIELPDTVKARIE